LRCKSLRESVEESAKLKKGTETEESQRIKKMITERGPLFYHNYPKKEIEKDVEWLKKLKVREVDRIEATYKLKTRKKTLITTCIIKKSNSSWILYVTPEYQYLDISQHLVRKIYRSNRPEDVLHVMAILSTSLSNLAKIYPVDCMQDIIDDNEFTSESCKTMPGSFPGQPLSLSELEKMSD